MEDDDNPSLKTLHEGLKERIESWLLDDKQSYGDSVPDVVVCASLLSCLIIRFVSISNDKKESNDEDSMNIMPSLSLDPKGSWIVADVVNFCRFVWEKERKRKPLWNDYLQLHQERMNHSELSSNIDTIFDQGSQAFSSLLRKCKEVREALADFQYISTMALSTDEFQNWWEIYRDIAEEKSQVELCAWKLSCLLSLDEKYASRRSRLLVSASCLAFFSYVPALISSSQEMDIESEESNHDINMRNQNEYPNADESENEGIDDMDDDLEQKIDATTMVVKENLKRLLQGIPISNKRLELSESNKDKGKYFHEKSQSYLSWNKSNSVTTSDCLKIIVESVNTLHWHLYCAFPDMQFGPPILRNEIETLMVDVISPIVAGLERFCEGSDVQTTKSSAILIDGAIVRKRRELQAKLPKSKALWSPVLSIFDESILLDEKYRNSTIRQRLIPDATESRKHPKANTPVAYVVEHVPGESRISEERQAQVKRILARLSSESNKATPREKIRNLENNLAWNEWCVSVTDRCHAKPGSRLRLLLENKHNVTLDADFNLRHVIWMILTPVIAKFTRRGLESDGKSSIIRIDEENCEVELQNPLDHTQQFVVSFVSLYYQLLENFLVLFYLDSKVQFEWMTEKEFHRGFLACSIFCISKAIGQPLTCTGPTQSDLATAIELSEATPTSTLFFISLLKRCLQISWTLPKLLEESIDHAQSVLLDSMVWQQGHWTLSDWNLLTMIQKHYSYQKRDPESSLVRSPSQRIYPSDSELKGKNAMASMSNDFAQSCQALWIPQILEQIQELMENRITAISSILGIRSFLPKVLSSARGLLSFILEHRVIQLLHNRHLDQIWICILHVVTQHHYMDVPFRQITDAYVMMKNNENVSPRFQDIVGKSRLNSSQQKDDCCRLEKFYTQVFLPEIESYFGKHTITSNKQSETTIPDLGSISKQVLQ